MNDKQPRHSCIAIAAIFVAALFLASCSDPNLSFIPEGGRILAFGDSLTVGVGADRLKSYPDILSELSGRHVINAGVSGETTDRGLARLPGLLAEAQPDLLILLEGGNDILRNKDLAETKSNLAAMIEMAQSAGVEVVLLGVPEKVLLLGVAGIYEELAAEYRVVFDGGLLGRLLRTSEYKSDPIHLNARGYRALATELHELLLENGAL